MTQAVGLAVMCGVCGASASEATALAEAMIISPPTIIAVEQSIRFGVFAATSLDQAVTVHPSGGRTMLGVLPADVDRARDFGPARFVVSSEGGWMFSITLPASAVVVSSSAGSKPLDVLPVTDFQIAPEANEGRAPGLQRLLLGATVTVRHGLHVGHYSGNVPITVSYE